VNEEGELYDEFGFATSAQYKTRDEIRVLDTSHYITSVFSSTGYYKICTSLQPFSALEVGFAPGSLTLADTFNTGSDSNNKPSLVVIETGGELEDGTTAAGRRVTLPWGGSDTSFDVSSLNGDGQAIMKRAIEWAGGAEDSPATDSNFGYETIFASSEKNIQNVQIATQVTLSEDGTLKSITAYINGRDKLCRSAIYTDSGGEPGTLIVESDAATKSLTDWHTFTVADTPLTAGTYWLAVSFSDRQQQYFYEPTGGQTRHVAHDAVTGGFLGNWGASSGIYPYQVSIYGTYTPSQ
jgi:hypothetical protein